MQEKKDYYRCETLNAPLFKYFHFSTRTYCTYFHYVDCFLFSPIYIHVLKVLLRSNIRATTIQFISFTRTFQSYAKKATKNSRIISNLFLKVESHDFSTYCYKNIVFKTLSFFQNFLLKDPFLTIRFIQSFLDL